VLPVDEFPEVQQHAAGVRKVEQLGAGAVQPDTSVEEHGEGGVMQVPSQEHVPLFEVDARQIGEGLGIWLLGQVGNGTGPHVIAPSADFATMQTGGIIVIIPVVD